MDDAPMITIDFEYLPYHGRDYWAVYVNGVAVARHSIEAQQWHFDYRLIADDAPTLEIPEFHA